ncbi:hypothetical protein U5A82_18735 [Sphingobium sp. CR2-8]|uniref:hypothetical protein n=1 Tax=Sphingobium sp. CR2-8 TaxID=1306534 RepID=UPI002DBDFB1A|nr:hypothetical protein [Sphingobium sp. CR2-8]MEC3912436.1 hypothetical protein [Sphingobium sp. CR2-8]
MKERPIGYYVHHHGAGHLARARAIAAASGGRVTLLGTGIGALGIDLADDRPVSGGFDGVDRADCRPDALHYAPIDHGGVRARTAAILQWIAAQRPSLMVVDVSVEVAMLARLASVPVVYVRLNGDRRDAPHLEAFRGRPPCSPRSMQSSTWDRHRHGCAPRPAICRASPQRRRPAFMGKGAPSW